VVWQRMHAAAACLQRVSMLCPARPEPSGRSDQLRAGVANSSCCYRCSSSYFTALGTVLETAFLYVIAVQLLCSIIGADCGLSPFHEASRAAPSTLLISALYLDHGFLKPLGFLLQLRNLVSLVQFTIVLGTWACTST
jgi:hypothetical protein